MVKRNNKDLVDVVEEALPGVNLSDIPDMRPSAKKVKKPKKAEDTLTLKAERKELQDLYLSNPALMKITDIPDTSFLDAMSADEVRARLQAARIANDYGADKVLASQAIRAVGSGLEMMWPQYLRGLSDELLADDLFADATKMYLTSKLFSKMSSNSKWTLAMTSKIGNVVVNNMSRAKVAPPIVPQMM